MVTVVQKLAQGKAHHSGVVFLTPLWQTEQPHIMHKEFHFSMLLFKSHLLFILMIYYTFFLSSFTYQAPPTCYTILPAQPS